MSFPKRTGFTLVELLVVMSILGVLVAALIVPVTNALESARTAKCKANLKNLALAAMNVAVETGYMPCAGSYEILWDGDSEIRYYLRPGWVGWTGSGIWPTVDDPTKPTWGRRNETSQCGRMTPACFWASTASDRTPYYSITNGCLWEYVGKDLSTYVCDKHKKMAAASGVRNVFRSYVMNGYFGYANKGTAQLAENRTIKFDSLSSRGSAANLLLLAEMPAYRSGHKAGVDTSQTASDSVLETNIRTSDDPNSTDYLNKTADEVIGFNHENRNRHVAHVAFADGHVDALMEPTGASDANLKKLTQELCNGDEIDQGLRKIMK